MAGDDPSAGVAILLAAGVKAFFVQSFYIPSGSMEPGVGQERSDPGREAVVLVRGGAAARDVIVFKDPGGWLDAEESAGPSSLVEKVMAKVGLYPAGGHLVKRVIGVPGDTIHCCDQQGRLVVNGHPLDESAEVARSGQNCDGPEVDGCARAWTVGPVPSGRLFVMGDNRAHSADSAYHVCHPRAVGCGTGPVFVPTSDVVGKVAALAWPPGRAHMLAPPVRVLRPRSLTLLLARSGE